MRAGDGNATEFLPRVFESATSVFTGDRAPRPLFVSFVEAIAQAERSSELREQMARHYSQARTAFAATLRDEIGGEDHQTTATVLLALFDGLMLQWLLDPKAIPTSEALLAAITHLVTRTVPA